MSWNGSFGNQRTGPRNDWNTRQPGGNTNNRPPAGRPPLPPHLALNGVWVADASHPDGGRWTEGPDEFGQMEFRGTPGLNPIQSAQGTLGQAMTQMGLNQRGPAYPPRHTPTPGPSSGPGLLGPSNQVAAESRKRRADEQGGTEPNRTRRVRRRGDGRGQGRDGRGSFGPGFGGGPLGDMDPNMPPNYDMDDLPEGVPANFTGPLYTNIQVRDAINAGNEALVAQLVGEDVRQFDMEQGQQQQQQQQTQYQSQPQPQVQGPEVLSTKTELFHNRIDNAIDRPIPQLWHDFVADYMRQLPGRTAEAWIRTMNRIRDRMFQTTPEEWIADLLVYLSTRPDNRERIREIMDLFGLQISPIWAQFFAAGTEWITMQDLPRILYAIADGQTPESSGWNATHRMVLAGRPRPPLDPWPPEPPVPEPDPQLRIQAEAALAAARAQRQQGGQDQGQSSQSQQQQQQQTGQAGQNEDPGPSGPPPKKGAKGGATRPVKGLSKTPELWGRYDHDGPQMRMEKNISYELRVTRARHNMNLERRPPRPIPRSTNPDPAARQRENDASEMRVKEQERAHRAALANDEDYAREWREGEWARKERNQQRRVAAHEYKMRFYRRNGYREYALPRPANDDDNEDLYDSRLELHRDSWGPTGLDVDEDRDWEPFRCMQCARDKKNCTYQFERYPCERCRLKGWGDRCVTSKPDMVTLYRNENRRSDDAGPYIDSFYTQLRPGDIVPPSLRTAAGPPNADFGVGMAGPSNAQAQGQAQDQTPNVEAPRVDMTGVDTTGLEDHILRNRRDTRDVGLRDRLQNEINGNPGDLDNHRRLQWVDSYRRLTFNPFAALGINGMIAAVEDRTNLATIAQRARAHRTATPGNPVQHPNAFPRLSDINAAERHLADYWAQNVRDWGTRDNWVHVWRPHEEVGQPAAFPFPHAQTWDQAFYARRTIPSGYFRTNGSSVHPEAEVEPPAGGTRPPRGRGHRGSGRRRGRGGPRTRGTTPGDRPQGRSRSPMTRPRLTEDDYRERDYDDDGPVDRKGKGKQNAGQAKKKPPCDNCLGQRRICRQQRPCLWCVNNGLSCEMTRQDQPFQNYGTQGANDGMVEDSMQQDEWQQDADGNGDPDDDDDDDDDDDSSSPAYSSSSSSSSSSPEGGDDNGGGDDHNPPSPGPPGPSPPGPSPPGLNPPDPLPPVSPGGNYGGFLSFSEGGSLWGGGGGFDWNAAAYPLPDDPDEPDPDPDAMDYEHTSEEEEQQVLQQTMVQHPPQAEVNSVADALGAAAPQRDDPPDLSRYQPGEFEWLGATGMDSPSPPRPGPDPPTHYHVDWPPRAFDIDSIPDPDWTIPNVPPAPVPPATYQHAPDPNKKCTELANNNFWMGHDVEVSRMGQAWRSGPNFPPIPEPDAPDRRSMRNLLPHLCGTYRPEMPRGERLAADFEWRGDPANECEYLTDDHMLSCTKCRTFQMSRMRNFHREDQTVANSRWMLCRECTGALQGARLRNARLNVRFGDCACVTQLRGAWLCNNHRVMSHAEIERRVLWHMNVEVGMDWKCPACRLGESEDNSGAWVCRCCKEMVMLP